MRVWDCHPRQLNRQHLMGEHVELHYLWNAVISAREDDEQEHRGWVNHPEAKRFVHRPELIVARHDLIIMEGINRGYKFKSRPEREVNGIVHTHDMYRKYDMSKYKSWKVFMKDSNWPESWEGGFVTPWSQSKMSFNDYKHRLGDNWTSEYKRGSRPRSDPYNIKII